MQEDDSVTSHEMWVDHGELVQGSKRTHVGTKASDLQKLIDALPPAKPLANVRSPDPCLPSPRRKKFTLDVATQFSFDHSLKCGGLTQLLLLDSQVTALVNSTQLRRLRLTGAYTADATLSLPSMFVLALDQGATYSGAKEGLPGDGINSLVAANGTYYTAIVGGRFDCSSVPMRHYPTCDTHSPYQRGYIGHN